MYKSLMAIGGRVNVGTGGGGGGFVGGSGGRWCICWRRLIRRFNWRMPSGFAYRRLRGWNGSVGR